MAWQTGYQRNPCGCKAKLERIFSPTSKWWVQFANGDEQIEGLAHVANLTQLECLLLNNTEVTDASFDKACRAEATQSLNLAGTHVTDAGLPQIGR